MAGSGGLIIIPSGGYEVYKRTTTILSLATSVIDDFDIGPTSIVRHAIIVICGTRKKSLKLVTHIDSTLGTTFFNSEILGDTITVPFSASITSGIFRLYLTNMEASSVTAHIIREDTY